ncbi:MAG TPA: hypothetical protein VNH11_14380 [Pirellulales bacterium]|nr:hypothetical protein [Pirellulales bacterium]
MLRHSVFQVNRLQGFSANRQVHGLAGPGEVVHEDACHDFRLPAASSDFEDFVIRLILPVGRSRWAIAAGYTGLFAVIIVPAPFAILLGVIAVIDLRRNPKLHGWGRAVFGLVMGVVCTMLAVIWLALEARGGT